MAVFTASEIQSAVTTDRLVVALPDRTYRQQRDRPILAADETVYVGEAIAMVVATDAYVAEDAAGMVNIEFELLEAVSDCRAALADKAPPVHSNGPDNLIAAFATSYGSVDAAFASAAHVIGETFWLHRGCANSIECRGCIGSYDAVDDKLTVWSSTRDSPGNSARPR